MDSKLRSDPSSDSAFFPKLESLVLDGDLSMCLIESLMISLRGLQKLTIFIHDLGYPTGL